MSIRIELGYKDVPYPYPEGVEDGFGPGQGNEASRSAVEREGSPHTGRVLMRAKEAGIMVAEELVPEVRSDMKAGANKGKVGKVAKTVGKQAPKTKAGSKGKNAPRKTAAAGKGGLSKAGFVRSQPTTMPAKEVVAAGAKLGLSLSPDYIHKVRSTAKAKAEAPAKKPAPKKALAKKTSAKKAVARKAAVKKPSRKVPKAAGAAGETAFRKLVIDLGVVRAKALLTDVERKVGALIAGI